MENYQYHIFSPYRVCPLGAHVDHQHGLVTGFAFDKGVDLRFTPTEDGSVHLKSLTFDGEVSFDVTKPSQVKEGNWGDYARGAKYALKKRFELTRGIEGVIRGSLPVGGLSSSAAVLTAYVMALYRHRPDMITKLREAIGRYVEGVTSEIGRISPFISPRPSCSPYSKLFSRSICIPRQIPRRGFPDSASSFITSNKPD